LYICSDWVYWYRVRKACIFVVTGCIGSELGRLVVTGCIGTELGRLVYL
jgi:hypothetical protein